MQRQYPHLLLLLVIFLSCSNPSKNDDQNNVPQIPKGLQISLSFDKYPKLDDSATARVKVFVEDRLLWRNEDGKLVVRDTLDSVKVFLSTNPLNWSDSGFVLLSPASKIFAPVSNGDTLFHSAKVKAIKEGSGWRVSAYCSFADSSYVSDPSHYVWSSGLTIYVGRDTSYLIGN